MALTLLPEEILEQIVKHLSIKDLLACSSVCVEWREKFNVDIFWKKFCITAIKDYLELIECEVEPAFNLPEQNEDQLQPLCRWRVYFMRNVHLINNWKFERYSSVELRPYTGVISSDVITNLDGVHWLFIRFEHNIEIWNIHTVPQLYESIPIFSDCPNVSVFIVGNRAVIAQWNIVSVYNLDFPLATFKILSRFMLEEKDILAVSFWDTIDKTDIDFVNEDDDFRFMGFGNLLVGYKRIPNPQTDLSMHLWDISKQEKIKIESMLHTLDNESEIAFTNIFQIDSVKGLIRLVFRSPENELSSQLFVYDFKKLKFTDTNILISGVVVWCGCAQNIVVTFSSHPGGTIRFHNYLSGKFLSVKEIGEYTTSEQIQLIDSYLVYCMFNCMNVLNIHTQEVIYCLEFSFYSFVRRVTVIEPRFVVAWLLERGGSPGCPSYYQEVWDMKDLSSKLLHFSSELGFEVVTNSSSIIKQIISYNGMIYVYTFW